MATYWEKLRDPRWQRRRLEVMEAIGFACYACNATDKTLNVHHKLYRKGANPWDYADHELVCLCEECHERQHSLRAQLDQYLALSWNLEAVLGYAKGLWLLEQGAPDVNPQVPVTSYEEAMGIAAAYGVEAEDVLDLRLVGDSGNAVVDSDGLIRTRQARMSVLRAAGLIGEKFEDG